MGGSLFGWQITRWCTAVYTTHKTFMSSYGCRGQDFHGGIFQKVIVRKSVHINKPDKFCFICFLIAEYPIFKQNLVLVYPCTRADSVVVPQQDNHFNLVKLFIIALAGRVY